ncbi:hypothetical protein KI387_040923, partial [Taxus chinensis]
SRAMSRSRGSFPTARVSRLSLLEALVSGRLEVEARWVAGGAVGGIEGETCAASMGVAAPVVGAAARAAKATGEAGLAVAEPIGAGLGEEGRPGYLR